MRTALRHTATKLLIAICLTGTWFAHRLVAQDGQAQDNQPQQPAQNSPQPQGEPGSKPEVDAQPVHDGQINVVVNDVTRTFVIHLPKSYDSQQHYPVVILLHGFDQDAAEIARITHFNDFADRNNIIAVYPNGLNGRWGIGAAPAPGAYRRGPYRRPGVWGPGPGYPPPGRRAPENRQETPRGPADIQFLNRVLDKVLDRYSVDSQRIYAAGLGEGGFVALRMGCNMAERIAGVATVGSELPRNLNCIPARPVPLLMMNGTDDPLVHYNGGRYKDGLVHLLSAEDSAKYWARQNHCEEKPVESKLPPLQKGGKDTKLYFFNDCEQGAQVALYAVKDAGNTWPGGEQFMNEKEIGKTSNSINADDTIWNFLSSKKIAAGKVKDTDETK
jgi:polyhydroxybutyrate depolymerase